MSRSSLARAASAREAYEHVHGMSKYNDIWEQINDLQYEDIVVKLDKYPIINESSFHICITSKEGYGMQRFVTSSNINNCFPIPNDELNHYIKIARNSFARVKQNLINTTIHELIDLKTGTIDYKNETQL